MINEATFISQNFAGWNSLALYFLLSTTICSVLAVISGFLSLAINQFSEKKAEYECGFEPFDSATRLPFEVHFYLVGILFLVFDVEIVVLLPWVVAQHHINWFGFFSRDFFICLLTVGFIFEWKRGALVWPSRTQETAYENKIPWIDKLVNSLFVTTPEFLPDFFKTKTKQKIFWVSMRTSLLINWVVVSYILPTPCYTIIIIVITTISSFFTTTILSPFIFWRTCLFFKDCKRLSTRVHFAFYLLVSLIVYLGIYWGSTWRHIYAPFEYVYTYRSTWIFLVNVFGARVWFFLMLDYAQNLHHYFSVSEPRRRAIVITGIAFSFFNWADLCFLLVHTNDQIDSIKIVCLAIPIFMWVVFVLDYSIFARCYLTIYRDLCRLKRARKAVPAKNPVELLWLASSVYGAVPLIFIRTFIEILAERHTPLKKAQVREGFSVFLFVLALVIGASKLGRGSLFDLLMPTVTLFLAVSVLLVRNPVHALLALIVVFFNTVVLFVLAQAEFLALVFLIVYVGAISILFLFVIRLLNVQELRAGPKVLYSTVDRGLLAVYIPAVGGSWIVTLYSLFRELADREVAVLQSAESSVATLREYISWRFTDIMRLSSLLYNYYVALFLRITVRLLTARLGGIILATKK